MTTHTPGPWRKGAPIVVNLGGFKVHAFPISGSGMAIAAVYNGSVGKEWMPGQGEANADLVANAPATHDAARAMLAALLEYRRCGLRNDAADAAIAQAEAAVKLGEVTP